MEILGSRWVSLLVAKEGGEEEEEEGEEVGVASVAVCSSTAMKKRFCANETGRICARRK